MKQPWGQLTSEYQKHTSGPIEIEDGDVTDGTPHVDYGYADGSGGTIRPTSITYPNGRVLHFEYSSAVGKYDDALNRVTYLSQTDANGTVLVQGELTTEEAEN